MISEEHVKKMLDRLSELETELSNPDTAANQKKYQQLLREHSRLKKLEQSASKFFNLKTELDEHREIIANPDSDPDLKELAESEIEELEEQMPLAEKNLKVSLLPPDPDEDRNAMVEIRAGTGGDEAALFAGDLFRMYSRFAETKGWKITLIDVSDSEVGGYKEAVFMVEGKSAYSVLQHEGGTHRVQRVPVTESSGRIHTSASTVAVLPEAEAEDDIDIPAEDIRIDIYRSSGPGGQSVNTTDSAVRLTHIPTGIVAQSQDEKSQHKNKAQAMKVLKTRVLDAQRKAEAEKVGNARRSQIGSGDRSERIRTYNFPQNRLTDHRINLTMYNLDRVMEGDLEELIEALRDHSNELRLQAELEGALSNDSKS
ncbi:peptide chain release factor 1 [bacterium E08(2017)]|nr:peptide chain release factor 1 [bacterium E08(2017)]